MFNEDFPSVFAACPRIIAIGDVHGDIGRLMDCLYATRIIDTNGVWIAEPKNTFVVQLGDQVDSMNRTPDAPDWEKLPDYEVLYFMDKLDKQARLHGGRVISLIGNHEIMNVLGDFSYVSPKSMDGIRRERFKPGGTLATLLSHRCVIVKIGSLLFVHGGVLPGHIHSFGWNIHVANMATRKFLRNEQMSDYEKHVVYESVIGDNGILWTRAYANIQNEQHLDDAVSWVLNMTSCKMICTGHNTVNSITPLCNGKLWFLDAGLSRAYGEKELTQIIEIIDDGAEVRIINLKN